MTHHIARWLRDEEAAGSNPATPDQLKRHVTGTRLAAEPIALTGGRLTLAGEVPGFHWVTSSMPSLISYPRQATCENVVSAPARDHYLDNLAPRLPVGGPPIAHGKIS